MSITSSTTASRDGEVPSPNSFQGRLLLILITRGDGIPLDASSISEEDIVEICVRRAHAHPMGMLQYSAAESVVLFGNIEDVNHAHHTLLDVTEFRNEVIMVRTMAPTEAQAATFHAMWHLNPTAGDGEPHTPPYQTPPNEEMPHHIHAQLGDLNDSELWQLVRDLSQELGQCDLTAPPSNPLLRTGHTQWAAEYQRKMTRRSPFQEGEGFPLDHCCNHHVLHWQDQIWGN